MIPLVCQETVHKMRSIYEAAEDDDLVDIVLRLDVRCTTDDTMSVTSDDLQLDPLHPGEPRGALLRRRIRLWQSE